jgi:putative phosphoribosyl transferase
MMESITYLPLYDRAQAGKLLAKKLSEYYRGNAVVVAIHNGGVPVASEICSSLELPLEVVGCKRIRHPANSKKSIGSICKDEVILHDCPYNLPQDYI